MNLSAAKIMSKVILSEKKVNIKLLGDSITHGVSGTGFKMDGETIVDDFKRNPDGFCWAKLFKDHMEKTYNCTVTNNACYGTSVEFIIDKFNTLVSPEDDIIICTIGTNNRHQYFDRGEKRTPAEQMKYVYENILALDKLFKESGKDYIFMSNIPASAANEEDGENYWRHIHMNHITDLYVKASFECGFPLITLYPLFAEYCSLKGISYELLLKDGLHPNDEGYRVMYRIIMKELGITADAVIKN